MPALAGLGDYDLTVFKMPCCFFLITKGMHARDRGLGIEWAVVLARCWTRRRHAPRSSSASAAGRQKGFSETPARCRAGLLVEGPGQTLTPPSLSRPKMQVFCAQPWQGTGAGRPTTAHSPAAHLVPPAASCGRVWVGGWRGLAALIPWCCPGLGGALRAGGWG